MDHAVLRELPHSGVVASIHLLKSHETASLQAIIAVHKVVLHEANMNSHSSLPSSSTEMRERAQISGMSQRQADVQSGGRDENQPGTSRTLL